MGFVTPNQTLTMDASEVQQKLGWGAVLSPHQRLGIWSREELLLHVNLLEALAVFSAIQAFKIFLQRSVILLQTNNTVVMAYVNKMGGTRSPYLESLAQRITLWCLDRSITLRAVHLSGADNVDRSPVLTFVRKTLLPGKIGRVVPQSRRNFLPL